MKTINTVRPRLFTAAWILAFWVTAFAAEAMEHPKAPDLEWQKAAGFGESDADGDGFLSPEEFASANHLSSAVPTSTRDIRATRIMAAFQAMDKDGDGRVSRKEYAGYLEKNGG